MDLLWCITSSQSNFEFSHMVTGIIFTDWLIQVISYRLDFESFFFFIWLNIIRQMKILNYGFKSNSCEKVLNSRVSNKKATVPVQGKQRWLTYGHYKTYPERKPFFFFCHKVSFILFSIKISWWYQEFNQNIFKANSLNINWLDFFRKLLPNLSFQLIIMWIWFETALRLICSTLLFSVTSLISLTIKFFINIFISSLTFSIWSSVNVSSAG